MVIFGRVLFVALLFASAWLGWRMLRRSGGSLPYWIVAWAAAGLSGAVQLSGANLPLLRHCSHPLGALFAALLLAGSLVFANRRVPRWLLPASLLWGGARALLAANGHEPLALLLAFAVEPWLVLAGAWIVWRSAPPGRSTPAERWLGPALAILAAYGGLHVAWLAGGGPADLLVPLWVVVIPPVLGVQIQASADRQRRSLRQALDARVAERTAALLESEARYRAVSELSADLSFRVRIDPALQLRTEWSAGAVEAITGRAPAALEGRAWLALLPASRHEPLRQQLAAMPLGRRFDVERRIVGPQGEERWIAVRVVASARDADGSTDLTGSASDITERRRAEQEQQRLERHLQQIQRLESLGVLAGGIAHDFNNLLTVIRGHAGLALAELPPDAPLRARLERIGEAAGHAAGLTGQMLTYAGKASPALVPLEVADVVASVGELLRAPLPVGVELAIGCEPALPAVEGDPGQLGQVLLNLAMNAADALREQAGPGRLEIRVAAETLDAGGVAGALGAALEPGRYVVVTVRDDGCGMDADTLAHVCEPFFTTKFSGRGLGMAAVLGIVRAHRGGLAIESAPGSGTTVRVLLPASEKPVAVQAAAATTVAAAPPRGVRVLVVDDDEAVRELGAEMLARAGFEVACAACGAEAVARVEAGERVDAVLLDLTMPELGGEATFLRLRALRPELPVVLVSGYDAEQARPRFAARGLDGFLRKPFEPDEVAEAVRVALERGGARPAPM